MTWIGIRCLRALGVAKSVKVAELPRPAVERESKAA